MKKYLRYILIIVLIAVIFVPTLMLLTACDDTYVYEGVHYTIHKGYDSYAEVNYFIAEYSDRIVCEVPSEVEYEGKIYPVTVVTPYQPFMSMPYNFVDGGYAVEIILPQTVTRFDYLEYTDTYTQFQYLEAITVHPDNEVYSSIDGVMYNAEGTELLLYPTGKQAETFTVPQNMLTFSPTSKFWLNKYIKYVAVDSDNVYYKAEDNVLYSYDGSELVYRVPNDVNYFAIPSTVSVIAPSALPNLRYLYVPKSVVLFLDSFVDADQPVTRIRNIYFEADTLPNYFTQNHFYGSTYLSTTLEEFEAAVKQK